VVSEKELTKKKIKKNNSRKEEEKEGGGGTQITYVSRFVCFCFFVFFLKDLLRSSSCWNLS
jgi:hypothetical protein